MSASTLACPKCGTPLGADDVNLAQALGRCRSCNCVFSLADQTGGARHRPEVEMPGGFHVTEQPNRLTITRRWLGSGTIVIMVCALASDGYLVASYWYWSTSSGHVPPLFWYIPLAWVVVGSIVTYAAFASLFNTTTITTEPNRFRVRHGPLPWPGGGIYDPTQIDQLFCRKKVVRSGNDSFHTHENYTCELYAAMTDGKEKKLIGGLNKPEQALFLEQRLEKAMGITDRPVAGELAM